MAGDVKEYLVNYVVNSTGNADTFFKKLATQAADAQKLIASSAENIKKITSDLTTTSLGVKDAFNITPTVNNENALAQLNKLEEAAMASAARIRKEIASALNGSMSSLMDDKKMKAKLDEMNNKQLALQKQFMSIASQSQSGKITKSINQLWGKEDLLARVIGTPKAADAKEVLKQLRETIEERTKLEKAVGGLSKATESTTKSIAKPATVPTPAKEPPVVTQAKQEVSKLDELKKVWEEKLATYKTAEKAYNDYIKKWNGGITNFKEVRDDAKSSFQRLGDFRKGAYKDLYDAAKKAGEESGAAYRAYANEKDHPTPDKDVIATTQATTEKIKKTSESAKKATEKVVKGTKAASKAVNGAISATESGVNAIENLNKPVAALSSFFEKYGGKKGVTINVNANVSPAIKKINGLLSSIEKQGAVIPVTFGIPGQKPGKNVENKAFSEATGKLTEAGKKRQDAYNRLVEKQKAQTVKGAKVEEPAIVKQLKETIASLGQISAKNPVNVVGKFDGSALLSQMQTLMSELKTYAKANPIAIPAKVSNAAVSSKGEKATAANGKVTPVTESSVAEISKGIQAKVNEIPIVFKSAFDGSNAAFQAQQSIVKLQQLVNEKPVVVKSKFAGISKSVFKNNKSIPIPIKVDTTGIASKISSALTSAKKSSGAKNGVTIPVKVSTKGIASQVNSALSAAKKSAGTKKGLNIPIKLSTAGISSKFSTLLKDLQAKAKANPIQINAQLNNSNAFTQLNETITKLQKSTANLGKAINGIGRARSGSYTEGTKSERNGGGTIFGIMPSGERVYDFQKENPSAYARMRAAFYPLTGNTSFGARTPAMVEMAKGMGTMFAVGGAMSAVGSSLSQAVQYQNTMKTAQAILQNGTNDYTARDFNTMTHTVRNVGKETKFTAPDVANAARFMAMAGLHTKDITAAIRPVADVALIGDTDLGTTADKLTNVMTTFGLNAKQMRDIADIMTSTFTRSNTDMLMLAESAKYAGGIAHLYGRNFKNTFADTMALFGVLGNAGIQASSAGTTIRMMYQNLMQPNKKQLETLKKYNIYNRDTNGEPLEMRDILAQISEKVPQNRMADAIGQMFRITAQPGAAALASNMPMVTQLIRANETAAGSGISQRIANEKKGTLSGLWAQVTSSFTEAVVQAVEGRQDKWAKMLGKVRDFLSDPKTIKGISSIIDLVEVLAKTMAKFAQFWAGAYNMFPKLINTWLQVQMIMTQVGYMLTPLVQVTSMLTMFKGAILGIGTALNGASVAGASMSVAGAAGRYVGAAGRYAGVVGGARAGIAGSRFIGPAGTIGALATSSMLPYLASYGATAAMGPLGSTIRYAGDKYLRIRGGYARIYRGTRFSNPLSFESRVASVNSGIKISELRQREQKLTALSNSMRTTLLMNNGRRESLSPLWFATAANIGLNARESYRFMRQRNAEGHILKRFTAAEHAEAKAAAIRSKINGRFAELRAIRRPLQYSNTSLMTRYGSMAGDTFLLSQAMNGYGHAERMDVSKGIFMRGGKNAAVGLKLGAKEALKYGIGFGMINGGILTSMMNGIKSAFFGLMKGLATAVGFLTSPDGLAIAAIGTFSAGMIALYKDSQKYQREAEKNAYKSGKNITRQTAIDTKNEQERLKKMGVIIDATPVVPDSNVPAPTKHKVKKSSRAPWSTSNDDQNVLVSKVLGHQANMMASEQMAYDNVMKGKYTGNALLGKNEKILDETAERANEPALALFDKPYKKLDNAFAAAQVARVKLISDAANSKKVLDTRDKIAQLYEQYRNKELTYKQYRAKAIALRNQFNPNRKGLLKAGQYTAEQINNSTPERFDLYQRSAFNILNSEIEGKRGSITGRYNAIEKFKKGMSNYTDQWWDAVAHTYWSMRTFMGQGTNKVQVFLRSLPNGRIDYSSIIEQVRQIIKNFQGNLNDFAELVGGVYKALSSMGGVKGSQYYSTARKFMYEQLKDAPITAQDAANYWDKHIKNGDAKTTWKGLNRSQYIKAISSNKSTDPTYIKQERDVIRHRSGDTVADTIVRQQKKIQKQVKGITNKKANTDQANIKYTNSGSNTAPYTPSGKSNSSGSQKDYASTYGNSASKPTQVVVNIQNLCNFDRTTISKDADSKTIMALVQNQVTEGIAQLSEVLLNQMAARLQDASPLMA